MWFLEDLGRYDAENQCVASLDRKVEWLDNVQWYIESSVVSIECDILIEDRHFPVCVNFPAGYPATPPVVLPREMERWSNHQYGAGGELCLELGPDNWHPDQHDSADILCSAEKLLRLELDHETDPSTPIPSRHETTMGQDLRTSSLRFAITEQTLKFLNELQDSDCATGTIVTCFHEATTGVAFLIRAQVHDKSWGDLQIPASALGHTGYEHSSCILPKRHSAEEFMSLHTQEGLQAVVVQYPSMDDSSTSKYVLARDTLDTWKLFQYWKDGSTPACYAPITVNTELAQHRTGIDQERLSGLRVAIVGLGSMGSRLAISLARSGVRHFLLIDDDFVQPVNLVRHDADWRSVGVHKVDHVAERLRALGSDINVLVRRHRLGGQEAASSAGTVVRSLVDCDLIVDATAIPDVFNFLGHITRRSKTTMVWMETFAGGIGGLIARARPDRDPDPFTLRAALNAYCEDHPDPGYHVQNYGTVTEDNAWVVASDADINIIAHYAALLTMDTLLNREPSDFDHPLYLIGLKRDWIFRAPFHTIPFSCSDSGNWGIEIISEERLSPAVEALKQAFQNTTERDADTSN